jgi:hypothetical protein
MEIKTDKCDEKNDKLKRKKGRLSLEVLAKAGLPLA